MNTKGFITVFLSVLLSALTAYALTEFSIGKSGDQSSDKSTIAVLDENGQAVRTVNLSLSDYPDFTYAAENCVDAVVYVKVTAKQQVYDPFSEFFAPFFGGNVQPQAKERTVQGSGSGVIIRQDGYIVTNNHVVSGATAIEVTLTNNKTYDAKVIGTDPSTDVALIKIEAEGLPYINFADSDKLRLGEWVLAIGSPLGEELRSTITAGIVSAKGRAMPSNPNEFKIESFIQTDAAVNPGNSGGALVNKEGKLVGINTAIISTTGAYSGYSFAVPSNIVHKIVSDLIDFGSVKRVMLGVSGNSVSEIAKSEEGKKLIDKLNLSVPKGVYVASVTAGSTAEKAGIKVDDVIIAVDSLQISSMQELQAKVISYHPGDKAVVRIIRDGKTLDMPVEFSENSTATGSVAIDGNIMFYGATLKAVDNGVLIVNAGSGKMAQAGAKDGFIIQYVNDQKVKTPQDVLNIAKKSKRSIFIEGLSESGMPGYFGFGKDE